MANIGVDKSLGKISLYEHRCLEKIKKSKNILVNMMINSIIKLLLKHQWFPPLKKLLKNSIVTITI